ncbi:hypothetical protein A3A67_05145 [Candidatus Peribacteria bacterium RIFCSPLOWO2_01_FULL_51_18]|nr:MAG: hypothetical protein A3C52_04135 [Candidatus Peribacteria bacterium RIFCSPHIGHO2_02_FULL_51_15]OGJ66164.1 MAG: hypothetical protein A3A67_05145 [Candidatus Peribacteria bacterium RIFCSPLOWO2_01_FULL_51_18]OGJ68876.1 MAG: hypothetical protein A3J34_02295 [Candidatus Peribacteria bacterium RIFCSPLOWO2_02_FULL_51_10]
MKIITVSWVRNEGDILETFVRHNSKFACRMIVIDHRSQDNSREILEKLKQEGLPLDIRYDEQFAHRQAEVLTGILQEIALQDEPDWIILLDGDEFLVDTNDGTVAEALAKEDAGKPLGLPWRSYAPISRDDGNESNVLKRITHRKSIESPAWWKTAVPAAALREAKGITVDFGSHRLLNVEKKPMPTFESVNLALAHFPVRTSAQITCKAVGGWLSDMLDPGKQGQRGMSFQWKAIFDELKEGRDFAPEDLTRLALTYASKEQWDSMTFNFTKGHNLGTARPDTDAKIPGIIRDPVATDFSLKYRHRPAKPWQVLLESAEDLAEEYLKLDKKSSVKKI